MKSTGVSIERRTERRKPESVLVRYSGSNDPKDESTTFVRFAATLNISSSGLCFRSPMPFLKSHRLSFMSEELWDDEREGVVRWCEMIYPGMYRIGVALL